MIELTEEQDLSQEEFSAIFDQFDMGTPVSLELFNTLYQHINPSLLIVAPSSLWRYNTKFMYFWSHN